MRDLALQATSSEVADFLSTYVAAYGSGTLDALQPFYSVETLIWPNQRLAVMGWNEVRQMFAPSFARFEIQVRVYLQEERDYGVERFLRFLTEVRLHPRDGGDEVSAFFRDFAVLRRSDALWTIHRNIDQPITFDQLAADLQRDPPLAVFEYPLKKGDI